MLWSKINSDLQFIYWASIFLLKVIDVNTRWKLTIKTPDINVIDVVLVSLLLTLNTFYISL